MERAIEKKGKPQQIRAASGTAVLGGEPDKGKPFGNLGKRKSTFPIGLPRFIQKNFLGFREKN
jgi:hypothetical protein